MRGLIACLLLWSAAAFGGEMAYTIRTTELKTRPYSDAETVATLAEKKPVEVVARNSGWMQIKADGASGWVKMLSLRFGDGAQKKGGDSGLGALFNVAQTGGSGSTVSTGVRGLSEEKLKNPQPDPQALEQLQRYSTSEREAQDFARNGKLSAQEIDYIPAPK